MDKFTKIPTSFFRKHKSYKHTKMYDSVWFLRHLFWQRVKVILSLCDEELRNAIALDIGCGEGVFLPTLSLSSKKVLAIDLDTSFAIQTVGSYQLSNVELIEGNFNDMELPDNYFDVIIAADVVEHMSDIMGCFNEIRRILRYGGTFVISIPTENMFYKLGQLIAKRIAGFPIQDGHFQTPRHIEQAFIDTFKVVQRRYLPINWLPVSLSGWIIIKGVKL